jgi:predicted Zn-dependent protease
MAMSKKDLAEAEKLVAKLIADGHDGYAIRMKSADVAELKKDTVKMKAELIAASKLDPSQVEPIQGLYDMAHKQQDAEGELDALTRLALLDQHDRKVWNMLLARLVEKGKWEDAVKIGEGALFVDVTNPKVHRLYARALARTGRFVSAVYELNSALVCKPKPKEQVEIYGELAKAYDKLKQPEFAARAREFAKQVGGSPAVQEENEPENSKKKGHPPMGT